jgi:hypothetical protein
MYESIGVKNNIAQAIITQAIIIIDIPGQKVDYSQEVPDVLVGKPQRQIDFAAIFLSFSVASIHKKEVAHHGDRFSKVVQ